MAEEEYISKYTGTQVDGGLDKIYNIPDYEEEAAWETGKVLIARGSDWNNLEWKNPLPGLEDSNNEGKVPSLRYAAEGNYDLEWIRINEGTHVPDSLPEDVNKILTVNYLGQPEWQDPQIPYYDSSQAGHILTVVAADGGGWTLAWVHPEEFFNSNN